MVPPPAAPNGANGVLRAVEAIGPDSGPTSGGGGWDKPGGTGYEQRRSNALEYWLNKSSPEEIQDVTKAPGFSEGEKLPLSEAQQRTESAARQETLATLGEKQRDEALFNQLWRQREIARIRPVPQRRGI
jgi:hypothetical protein